MLFPLQGARGLRRKTEDRRQKARDGRNQSKEARVKEQESRVKKQEARWTTKVGKRRNQHKNLATYFR